MGFVFDTSKSIRNLEKHGIDFFEAQQLWSDQNLIELPSQSNVLDEARSIVVGKLDEKHWSAIITYRNEDIRIISVRRSRKKEIELYEIY
ncbi:MAG: BrnT family toxin [Deltaproteobacteria bacterium]|jgi:uncharacterized protein|nr:BrnT family toxin [Deltaproteobacteria bacterium]MBT4266209.1 BrnT family toxin [Deltaproteobacteria bacterium]MBT4641218.1 BrnT family toxin [Deltaproteobacteria bacterium]MBT6498635.1 BrnT family toxin [Deltaproteobacteria bacterium]MBT6613455.1 BrnT family toxin [Deltaproteobacteria bacterium]